MMATHEIRVDILDLPIAGQQGKKQMETNRPGARYRSNGFINPTPALN